MVESGEFDMGTVLSAALGYMSEDDVKSMCEANDFSPFMFDDSESNFDDVDFDDHQPTESEEWASYDVDC